ncbi:MAG: hypothetical protein D6683_04360 [Actinomyces sp.]|nr:MAG: hypothetical protein D6683_04360 [Actinomyces sp.]
MLPAGAPRSPDPPLAAGLIARPRLLARLRDRFRHRVTVLEAPAGFGKTSIVGQAVRENLLAPHGRDHWVSCRPELADPDLLVDTLARTVASPPSRGLDGILDALAQPTPTPVCLIVDDLHTLGPDPPAVAVLQELLDRLPTTAHLLVTSRHPPPLRLARLRARGDVLDLTRSELAFDADELAALAARHATAPDAVDDLGGWPALVSLALHTGRVRDYLDEEILDELDPGVRESLRVLVALGGADADLLRALGADPTALAHLPLVERRGDMYRPHDLWRHAFDELELGALARRHGPAAVASLIARGRGRDAVDTALSSGDAEAVAAALRAVLVDDDVDDVALLRSWLARLEPPPWAGGTTPAGDAAVRFVDHLRGRVLQVDDPAGDATRDAFERALDGHRRAGDPAAELVVLAELAFHHHVRRDPTALAALARRLGELAVDEPERAAPLLAVADGLIALARGDAEAMGRAVAAARRHPRTGRFGSVAHWIDVQARQMLGLDAVEAADAFLRRAGRIPGTEVIAVSSRLLAGRIDELLDGGRFVPDRWFRTPAGDRDRFLQCIWQAVVELMIGDITAAAASIDRARRHARTPSIPQVAITLALADSILAHEAGDTPRALDILDTVLERHPLDPSTRLVYNGAGALLARHRPATLGAARPTPFPDLDVALGSALGSLDADADPAALADAPLPPPGRLLAALFLRSTAEYLTAAAAAGHDVDGHLAWIFDLVGAPARAAVRSLAEHPCAEVAAESRRLLARIPAPPPAPLRLRIVGSARLERDGHPVDHPDWRRERVRSLLGHLAVHGEVGRDAVLAALWPDADPDAARRSLRTTLNLLLGVLEPGRAAGDASYLVRTSGDRLRLVVGAHLSVDLHEVREALAQAAAHERNGAPSLALPLLLEALEMWDGPLLTDSGDAAWLDDERRELEMRLVNAGIRAAELLVALGRVDEAVAVGHRVLRADPWAEAAHAAIVRAHLLAGRPAAARRAVFDAVDALEEIGGPAHALAEILADPPPGAGWPDAD